MPRESQMGMDQRQVGPGAHKPEAQAMVKSFPRLRFGLVWDAGYQRKQFLHFLPN